MNWKNWPYWVKGGAIALILPFLLYMLEVSFGTSIFSYMTVPLFVFPLFLIARSIENIFGCTIGSGILAIPDFPTCESISELLIGVSTWLFLIALYFTMGTLIGHFYGKFKNRREVV